MFTEYRGHALEFIVTRQPVPEHASSAFGDSLRALASLLVGKYRLQDALSETCWAWTCPWAA